MRQSDFAIRGYQIETDAGFEWVIEYPDLPGIVGGGASYSEALREAEENKRFYLEHLRDTHQIEPAPKDVVDLSDLSGKLTLRLSKTLHRAVVLRAADERVSINSLINEALSVYLTARDAGSLIARILSGEHTEMGGGRNMADVDSISIQEQPTVYGARESKMKTRRRG